MESSRLFQPLKLGHLNLSNRFALAPLTRFRSDAHHVPILPMVSTYYAQRACVPGTLLITEATFISPRAGGYPNVPGIYSDAQIAAWKDVTDAVHAQGSYIFLQLWALGRAAKAETLSAEGGYKVVSSSDISLGVGRGGTPADQPTAIPEDEIAGWVEDYATAAKNAVERAGFDGVEIHGANGYLLDQFTQDVSNKRTDGYGGSVEKRSRFGLEVAKAVVDAVGAERTGIRLSPWSNFQDMRMEDPIPQFMHLIKGLRELKLTYLHVTEPRIAGGFDKKEGTWEGESNRFVHDLWDVSPILVAGGITPENARQLVDEVYPKQDVVAVVGRYWISTPDLVYRAKKGIEWTKYDRDTFYKPGSPEGYIDYPFSEEFQKETSASKL